VNPPVDAPTSIARLPVTGMPKRSIAASSFFPARLTNGSGFATRCTASAGETSVEGLGAALALTRTRPASIARRASDRLSTILRRTSSVSSLRLVRMRPHARKAAPLLCPPTPWQGVLRGLRRSGVHRLGRRPRVSRGLCQFQDSLSLWICPSSVHYPPMCDLVSIMLPTGQAAQQSRGSCDAEHGPQ